MSRVLAGVATVDVAAGVQDGKMLANRLKVLLGTSTFLQAFQHSGALSALPDMHGVRSFDVVLSCNAALLPHPHFSRAHVPKHHC